MAKKHFGRLLAFAAIAGAAAGGISYFLRYKSFHKELDEDFHDFEDDFEDDLKEFENEKDDEPVTRNYVSLNPERQGARDAADQGTPSAPAGDTADSGTDAGEETEDSSDGAEVFSKGADTDAETVSGTVSSVQAAIAPDSGDAAREPDGSADQPKKDGLSSASTTIIEDTAE